jgi:hypothetical protein
VQTGTPSVAPVTPGPRLRCYGVAETLCEPIGWPFTLFDQKDHGQVITVAQTAES